MGYEVGCSSAQLHKLLPRSARRPDEGARTQGDGEGRRQASPRHAIWQCPGRCQLQGRRAWVVAMKLEVVVLPVAATVSWLGGNGWLLQEVTTRLPGRVAAT
jgi:hypothetical protein